MTQQEFDKARILRRDIDALCRQMESIKTLKNCLDSNIPDSSIKDVICSQLKVNEGRRFISDLLSKLTDDYAERLRALNTEFDNL